MLRTTAEGPRSGCISDTRSPPSSSIPPVFGIHHIAWPGTMPGKKAKPPDLPAPQVASGEPLRLTQFSHGGGCGCKIAPGVLEQILARTSPVIVPRQLLVGIETSDDAAVYQLNAEQALVATTDFFMPIVDDPFDFGCIAATNALSDVYAMGGVPLLALAIVGMPVSKLPLEAIKRILEGGESICSKAGIPIAGGTYHRLGRADLWSRRHWPSASRQPQTQFRRPTG
jgi:hypothetical protein